MNKLNLLAVLLVVTTIISSCIKEDFDKPPIKIPIFDSTGVNTISIADLKLMYQGALNLIDTDLYVRGRITANDESGNLYKKMEFQDATAGIEIGIDATSLFNSYHIGQRIYIKLKGLYIGEYNGLKQLGYTYTSPTSGLVSIGRMPSALIATHIFKDSLPGTPIQPKLININAISDADLSMLIKIEGARFELPGTPYADPDASASRYLVDENGVKISPAVLLRNSNYASFATKLLPAGKGNIVGILSIYNSDWQIYIRDLNDVQGFVVPTVLLNSSFAANYDGWIIKSQASNKDWFYFGTDPCMVMNGVGADVASKDWLVSPEVDFGAAPNSVLTFKTIMKNTDSGTAQPLKIKISSSYTGDATTTTWTDVTATISTAGSWTGNTVSGFPSSGKYRIAFYYESSGTTNTTATAWQIKDVKLAN